MLSVKTAFLISFSLFVVYMLGVSVYSFAGDAGIYTDRKEPSLSALLSGGDDPQHPREELLPGQTLDINTATRQQLAMLPDIGDVLSDAIVVYRQEQGAFSKIEDIMNVYGIGQGRFETIKDKISIGEVYENTGS